MQEPDPTLMHTLGDAGTFAPQLESLQSAPGTYLPLPVVVSQAALARHSQHELMRLIVDAAVALAVVMDGSVTPRQVLERAADGAVFKEWHEKTKPEIKRIRHRQAAA